MINPFQSLEDKVWGPIKNPGDRRRILEMEYKDVISQLDHSIRLNSIFFAKSYIAQSETLSQALNMLERHKDAHIKSGFYEKMKNYITEQYKKTEA